MKHEILALLEYIERERGLKREVLISALESAILSASRKSIAPASEVEVKIDTHTGDIKAWATLTVVEGEPENPDQISLKTALPRNPGAKVGDVIRWEMPPENFGRIAAQTGKQTILQALRRAEKETVCAEFSDRVGQIINGVVRRFEAGAIIIDFQKAEGILAAKDKIHGEQYMVGDRINALLVKVDPLNPGPSLIVSRTSPQLVERLFEREVTEIHDGVVRIMGIAREPGSRSKIAVTSSDPRVDPVGACVGMRGTRVRNITNELSGERIDIIPYSEDICQYAVNALQPATVQSVEAKQESKELIVHVTEEQSKLAFGKKAQNVRLCSKLLGWNINIRTEDTFADKLAAKIDELATELGVSNATAATLAQNGYLSLEGLKLAGKEQILEIEGIDEEDVEHIFGSIEG